MTLTNKDGDIVGERLMNDELDVVVSGTYSARPLARGEWCSFVCPYLHGELLALRLNDLKDKYLFGSAGTSNVGVPRKTQSSIVSTHRQGLSPLLISRPAAAAVEYSSAAQAIDVYNHVRTASLGLEDWWQTMSPKVTVRCTDWIY